MSRNKYIETTIPTQEITYVDYDGSIRTVTGALRRKEDGTFQLKRVDTGEVTFMALGKVEVTPHDVVIKEVIKEVFDDE